MRAVVAERYGIDALELKEIETPALPDDRILVRVRAAALNKLDWYSLTGTPLAARVMTGVRRPKSRLTGHDFAGIVEAVGKDIHGFQPGDEVFGANSGALGEVVRTMDGRVAPKPANLSFEEASAVPIAALTALQGLRDHGQVQPGQHVLVHGASGGVGTFAVQIAKAFGAEVTGVCSSRNVALVRSMGADHVIDYTKEDFTAGERRYGPDPRQRGQPLDGPDPACPDALRDLDLERRRTRRRQVHPNPADHARLPVRAATGAPDDQDPEP
jgi:NADPH:quinone reductase-like Zn-dependent oxidoreductase